MGAAADGRQHLLRLRGREHEDQVLGRLLHDLEQRIEARRRDHVGLVHDEDAVARFRRRVERAVTQLTGVVHAAVAGRVELDDVEVARAAGSERDTRAAHSARRRRRTLDAVERPRQDACGRRLATPARAGEEVGVIDALRVQCDGQRLGDMLLPDHFRERRWTVLPVQGHARESTDVDRQNGRREPTILRSPWRPAWPPS